MHPALSACCLALLPPTANLSCIPGGQEAWRRAPGSTSSAGALVETESRISHPALLPGEEQEVFLYVALRGADVRPEQRLDLNLALVVDRSGSMGSQDKLVQARAAAEQLVERLGPRDRLAIVVYDDEIETVVPSSPVDETGGFKQAIRALRPGGNTNLFGGLAAGCDEVLEHYDEGALNQVLLLSDGLANQGLTDRAKIGRRVQDFHERGLRISTMGMGLDYDEELLDLLARNARGNYSYVDHAEAVGKHLDREIDQLAAVVARDLELRVELGDGVRLEEVYRYPSRSAEDAVVVQVPDLCAGETRKVLVRLAVCGTGVEEQELAHTSLSYVGAHEGGRHVTDSPQLACRAAASLLEVERERDLEVLIRAEVVRNAVAMDEAMDLQKRGQHARAQELLAARYLTSRTLNEAEYRSAELTRILVKLKQVLQDLERTRHDAHASRDLQLRTQLEALGYM